MWTVCCWFNKVLRSPPAKFVRTYIWLLPLTSRAKLSGLTLPEAAQPRFGSRIVSVTAFKLKATDLPVEEGNRAAVRQLGINESMVRRWSRQREELTQCVLLPCYRHCYEKKYVFN